MLCDKRCDKPRDKQRDRLCDKLCDKQRRLCDKQRGKRCDKQCGQGVCQLADWPRQKVLKVIGFSYIYFYSSLGRVQVDHEVRKTQFLQGGTLGVLVLFRESALSERGLPGVHAK